MESLLNNNQNKLEYTGDKDYQPISGETDPETQETLYPYIPVSEGLIEAVNLAIKLNRPLLLEGEPGCGKTRLAHAVAYELGKKNSTRWPYADWNIKSSDQARDGLYIYDAVRRLFDAQLVATYSAEQDIKKRDEIIDRLNDLEHTKYITWGALGKAFKASNDEKRMIVLIDEIDKADTDFPNDLLLELDEKRFFIKETGKEVKARSDYAPIIFITSNGQRKLPDAFLRRCLYHYIDFPEKENLIKIINAHFGGTWSQQLTNKVINIFISLRKLMEEEKGEFGKKVSTSELIDWVRALQLHFKDEEEIKALLSAEDNKIKIPFAGTLLKNKDDRCDFSEIQLEDTEMSEDEESDSE